MIYSAIRQNRGLYGSVLLLALFLIVTATGGGLFGSYEPGIVDWQHRAFEMLCHQEPARSFWFNGMPMAVCARCYGIYAGFTLFWILMPLLYRVQQNLKNHNRTILLAAIVLNVIDVIGNLLGFWQNTLLSRFFLGSSIGISAVLLLADEFLTTKKGVKQESYGFKRAI